MSAPCLFNGKWSLISLQWFSSHNWSRDYMLNFHLGCMKVAVYWHFIGWGEICDWIGKWSWKSWVAIPIQWCGSLILKFFETALYSSHHNIFKIICAESTSPTIRKIYNLSINGIPSGQPTTLELFAKSVGY